MLGCCLFLHRYYQRGDGRTSLITVPVMLQFGIEPHVAVATNMLALIFLSLGGTLPLLKS